jgi:hypothetical protein
MRATDNFTGNPEDLGLYEIRIQGRLDERWTEWLEGLKFTHGTDGTTTLTGPLADQAALHGVLNKIRDLALPIVSVRRVDHPRTTTETA